MKRLWIKYNMGGGWECLIITLALFSVIGFVLLSNWWALIWAIYAGIAELFCWKTRLEKEKVIKQFQKYFEEHK